MFGSGITNHHTPRRNQPIRLDLREMARPNPRLDHRPVNPYHHSFTTPQMHPPINHGMVQHMWTPKLRGIFSILSIPFLFGATPALPPVNTPDRGEWIPGTPVTDESIEAGLQEAREALRASPEFQSNDGESHLRLAYLLSHQGDPNGAIEEFRTAIRLDPSLTEAYRSLGAVLIDKHEWKPAIDALQTAVRLDPQDSQAYYWLGRAHLARQEYDKATQAFLQACHHGPGEPEPWSDLGLSYMAQGQGSQANAALLQAIQLQPDFAEAHQRMEIVRIHGENSKSLRLETHVLLSLMFRRE